MSNCVVQSTQSDAELAATKLARESVEKRTVLMLNDYPLGVYTTDVKAMEAANVDWKNRVPLWQTYGLTLGQALYSVVGTKAVPYMKWFYRTYEFTVDAEARL